MPNQYDYPGVYIEEQQVAGPIQPVGTSTAAFIGVARNGPINQPTFITSFDEFRAKFDDAPIEGFYLWYAVRGFFENGGRRCYIVRVSAGKRAHAELLDSRTTGDKQPALLVEATEPGAGGNDINVTVTHTTQVTAQAYRPAAQFTQANGDRIQFAQQSSAAQFRPGDRIRVSEDGHKSAIGVIQEVRGTVITLTAPLESANSNGSIRLADIGATDKVKGLRLQGDAANLASGSVISITEVDKDQEKIEKGRFVVRSVQPERISDQLLTYRVELENDLPELNLGNAVEIKSEDFKLEVKQSQGTFTEPYEYLSMSRGHPRYAPTYIAQQQQVERERRRRLSEKDDEYAANWKPLATIREPEVPTNAEPVYRRPEEFKTAQSLAEGADGTLRLEHYQDAINALRTEDEVNFVAIPDSDDPAVQDALLTHCTQMADRFAIFHSKPVPPTGPGGIRDQVALLRSDRGFGALYYPWIQVPHPKGGLVFVPPSGHVAGVYVKADMEQGVHKAPANYTLNGALGVATKLNDEMQGPLNLDGINVLRVFPGQARPVVWGARTTSNDTAWQYVNIRRLLMFIEESIEEGVRWAVFQPNNLQLWQKLKRTISAFLTNVWRTGGLFGATPEEAFYVRIDETNNPEEERKLGRLYIEIGVRPVYPAEFIIVRIGFWEGNSQVVEGR